MKLRAALRLIEIQRVLVRHGLDEFVRATHLYRPLRFIFLLSPWVWFQRRRGGSRAERLRLALQELGPIFVKFGQALSTRRDLLPVDIADELAKLQDRVPPFDGEVARGLIESALGKSTSELFSNFDVTPLAAASIAQVHTANLQPPGGQANKEVIIKVLRPGMREMIQRDLEVLHALAQQAERWWPESKRLRPAEVVDEYEKTILDELDLMREAANAAQLRRNFAGSTLLYVPEIYWDLCRGNVMVMERIRGIQISNMTRLRELNVDIRKLAENGVEIFFTQVFRHNFFHADMHPGNIFVLADDPANPVYAAVDFGIVGTLDLRDQRYLAENFLAVFDRDYRKVAVLHVESGWVPRDTRVDEMESAIRTVCEPIFDKPLKEISFGTVLLRLFEISRRFNMTVQPQLILLQKTLLNIEGLGRDLYPDLDIWQTASPILRRWMQDRFSARSVLQSMQRQIPDVIDTLRALPPLLRVAAQRAEDGRLRLGIESQELEELKRTVQATHTQRDVVLIAAVLLLGGIIWLAVERTPSWPGWLLTAAAIAALVWRIRRR
ncbi:MAG: ubiquinone biosynthesis regulatory protein kinase UbiB [Proteobacteria bacterium]|jgi:ubiquinone biosynthesis protein|nr:ubiquinone biosynthesis regulatory protein kinase UbiB [Pseudomonadota bacterium]